MKSNEFIARLRDGQYTRRDALKTLGAMGFAVSAMPLGIRSAVAADNATYFTWGGYDDDGMFAPYIAKHGGPPNYVCLLYTSPSPRDKRQSRMPSSA